MKMKKRNYIIPFLVAVFVMFTGCNEDLLDIEQKGVIGLESFYITDEDAEHALVAMYADFITNIGGNDGIYVPYNIFFNYPADNVLAAGNEYGDNDQFARINEFRYDAQSAELFTMYSRLYFVIYRANLIINNFTEGDSPTINRAIAEARVVRAWCHMKAAMLWKSPPVITTLIAFEDRPANNTMSHTELLEWCAKEAGEAAQYLDERESIGDKAGAVKVTKGWAWTVEGQAYLYAGNYESAKTALKKVIDSGKYALVPGEDWASLFHIEGDGSPEKVFELNLVNNNNIGDWSGKIQRSTWMELNLWGWRTDKLAAKPLMQSDAGWGGLAIERDFAHEFAAHDGDSHRRKGTMLHYNEFITEIEWASDEKLNEDGEVIGYLTEAEKLADPDRGVEYPDGLYGQNEYLQRKFIGSDADRTIGSYRFNNFIITRYADVLLMYAEACAQTTDDGSGLAALQEVQTRAGAPVSASLTLDDVKRERNYELWNEGSRWIDMKRWNEFDGLANRGKNIPSLKDAFFTDGEAEHRGYVTFSNPNDDAKVNYGFEPKHEWFPYPYHVTSTNPNITQNDGWN